VKTSHRVKIVFFLSTLFFTEKLGEWYCGYILCQKQPTSYFCEKSVIFNLIVYRTPTKFPGGLKVKKKTAQGDQKL